MKAKHFLKLFKIKQNCKVKQNPSLKLILFSDCFNLLFCLKNKRKHGCRVVWRLKQQKRVSVLTFFFSRVPLQRMSRLDFSGPGHALGPKIFWTVGLQPAVPK